MLMDIIKKRHSIRTYTDKQISRSDLEIILEAGNYAPNAGGGQCMNVCPQSAITEGKPFNIDQTHCLHCGACSKVCPVNAIVKRG